MVVSASVQLFLYFAPIFSDWICLGSTLSLLFGSFHLSGFLFGPVLNISRDVVFSFVLPWVTLLYNSIIACSPLCEPLLSVYASLPTWPGWGSSCPHPPCPSQPPARLKTPTCWCWNTRERTSYTNSTFDAGIKSEKLGYMFASFYQSQCWSDINWTIKNKFQWNLNQYTNIRKYLWKFRLYLGHFVGDKPVIVFLKEGFQIPGAI